MNFEIEPTSRPRNPYSAFTMRRVFCIGIVVAVLQHAGFYAWGFLKRTQVVTTREDAEVIHVERLLLQPPPPPPEVKKIVKKVVRAKIIPNIVQDTVPEPEPEPEPEPIVVTDAEPVVEAPPEPVAPPPPPPPNSALKPSSCRILRNGVFLAVSVNKGVTVISDFGPPNVNF